MKFGETFEQRSVPQFAIHNIDYEELKRSIKQHTSPSPSKPQTIPSKDNLAKVAQGFEDELYDELRNQHLRVNDFVRVKHEELLRRLTFFEKQISELHCHDSLPHREALAIHRKVEKGHRLDSDLQVLGDDIEKLSRFAKVNLLAIERILKKYKRWTRSCGLESRFRHNVLKGRESLKTRDFQPLFFRYAAVLDRSREPHPARVISPPPATPKQRVKRRSADSNHLVFSSPAAILHAASNQSASDFDGAFATSSLSASGTRAVYWIHQDNVLNLQILLLRYASSWKVKGSATDQQQATSSGNSRPCSASSLVSPSSSVFGGDRYTHIVCDSLPQFEKRQISQTIQGSDGKNTEAGKAAANIEITDDEKAVVSLRENIKNPHDGKDSTFVNVQIRRSAISEVFKSHQSFSPSTQSRRRRWRPASSLTAQAKDEFQHVAKWFTDHPEVEPLARLSCRRGRFCGMHNSNEGGLWVTLDEDISIKPCSREYLVSGEALLFPNQKGTCESSFPHAILHLRAEGEAMEGFVGALDKSHLVERVHGFSLETHALYMLYKPSKMSPPSWLPNLNKDIRKVPQTPNPPDKQKVLSKRRTATHSTSRTSASEQSGPDGRLASIFSMTTGESSVTSAPGTQGEESEPYSKLARKQRHRRSKPRRKKDKASQRLAKPQQRHSRGATVASQQRYWNEFDDGSVGDADNEYAIYVDPDATSGFPGGAAFASVCSKLLENTCAVFRWLTNATVIPATPDLEQEPLLHHESSTENSAVTDEESAKARQHSHLPNSYARHGTESERDLRLHRCCITAFAASLALLVAAAVLVGIEHRQSSQNMEIGVIIVVLLAYTTAILGSGCMVGQRANLGWKYRGIVIGAGVGEFSVGLVILVMILNPLDM